MSSCGGSVSLNQWHDQVRITTPDYQKVNGSYFSCTWFIKSPPESTIYIAFNDLALYGSAYVRVHDGSTTSSRTLLHLSGSERPEQINSTYNSMTINYYISRDTFGRGASFIVSILEGMSINIPFHNCVYVNSSILT